MATANAEAKKEISTDKATAADTITTISDKTTQETTTSRNTTMGTGMDTGMNTARGGSALKRQQEQRADEHANTAEGENSAERNIMATANTEAKKETNADKATAAATIATISGKTTRKKTTILAVQAAGHGGDYPAEKANTEAKQQHHQGTTTNTAAAAAAAAATITTISNKISTSLNSVSAVNQMRDQLAAEVRGRKTNSVVPQAEEYVHTASTVAAKQAAGNNYNAVTTTAVNAATTTITINNNTTTGLDTGTKAAGVNTAALPPPTFGDRRAAAAARENDRRGEAEGGSRRDAARTAKIRRAVGSSCSRRRALQRQQQQQQRKSKTKTTRKKNNKQLVLWMLLGISMAMGWMGRAAEAAFAPGSRAELMPSSGEGGVFGCVGACGESLQSSGDTTFCSSSAGSWRTGTGVCVNADTDVPSGQGTGKYGAIGSWDVSAVESLAYGAWDLFFYIIFTPFFSSTADSSHISIPYLPLPHSPACPSFVFFLSIFFIFSFFFPSFLVGCSRRGFESRPYPMQHSTTPEPSTRNSAVPGWPSNC